MDPILQVDLFDNAKKLIAKKDTPIDFKLVRELMDHGTKLKKNFVAFGDTDLFKHFVNIFNEEKYFTIFTPYTINEEISTIARNAQLTKELVDELKSIKSNLPYTFRHILLVTALIIKMAIDLRDKGYDPLSAAVVGLVHDLGKSRIPKQILGKDTPLTTTEFNVLKSHPLISYLLLCYYLGNSLNGVPNAARDHHEKIDGSGYPRNLTSIEKYALLITPVDIFDALISERPYRGSSFSIRQALDFLIEESNSGKIDKEVVYYLISYVRKEHPRPEELRPYDKKTTLIRPDTAYGKVVPDPEDDIQTI